MAETVAQYAVGAFIEPQNGESPIDADQVRANDNTMRTGFNSHDADPGVHFQSSVLAARPGAGMTGRKWFSSDTRAVHYDNGSSWAEVNYLNLTNGGTVAGATTFTGAITSTAGSRLFGATTFTGALSGTSATFASSISAAGATLTNTLTGTSAVFSSSLSAASLTLTGALSGTSATFSSAIRNDSFATGFVIGQVNGTRRIQWLTATSAFSFLTSADTAAGIFAGEITATSLLTGAPIGGTAAAWKCGSLVTTTGLTLSTTKYVQLDIAGTAVKLAVVT